MNLDKNTITGWVLMVLVMFGFIAYERYTAPTQEEIQQWQAQQDSIKAVELNKKLAQQDKEARALMEQATDSLNPLFAASQKNPGTTVIKNELLSLTIDNLSGQLVRAELLDSTYKNQQGGNVVLFEGEGNNTFQLLIDGKAENINTAELYFTPTDVKADGVTMCTPVGSGQLCISYKLLPQSYLVGIDVQAKGLEGFFSSKTREMGIAWNQLMTQQEKGWDFENRYSTITYRDMDEDTHELSSMGGDEEESEFEEKAKWISFKTQFFSQILIAEKSLGISRLKSTKVDKEAMPGYLKNLESDLTAEFDPSGKQPTRFMMYLGPNKFSTLTENEKLINSDNDLDLRSLVYLGWPVVRWINRFFMIYLFDWLTGWGLNMGIVLLILTLLIKFLVYPLMKKSYMSSARMRVLRPKIEEVTKKYTKPEDAMLKQQETMKLYSEYGVSPMGGCLPMLIQMPVWIALFNFIPNAIELRGQSFLWANDLSTYDDVINWGFNVWGIGDHISLFCVLWCVATVASSMFSMKQQQDSMTPEQAQQMSMMKYMTYIMPLVFFFSFNNYSSGLNYYYFLSSLTSALMMWYLRKSTDDAKLLAQLEERHKQRKQQAATGKKPSSMMSRLQAMQEKQLEILRQQQEAQKK
ncbi:MAG: membrane protein insertase YidC [Bacteroidaceae bacterium]|nr:membrane protein insertase YidC [Bacteroidaceae bacterium]